MKPEAQSRTKSQARSLGKPIECDDTAGGSHLPAWVISPLQLHSKVRHTLPGAGQTDWVTRLTTSLTLLTLRCIKSLRKATKEKLYTERQFIVSSRAYVTVFLKPR